MVQDVKRGGNMPKRKEDTTKMVMNIH